jgi:hypothetical protein
MPPGPRSTRRDKTFQQTALMVAVRANLPILVRYFIEQGRR